MRQEPLTICIQHAWPRESRLFTFGREHERKCAVAYVRNPAQAALIVRVVDAVHDVLEGTASEVELAQALRVAFVEGGSGVWEQAGSWLRKSAADHPPLDALWLELSRSPDAAVRFRVACSLGDMPAAVRPHVASILLADKSRKVVAMARERTGSTGEPHADQRRRVGL